MFAEQRITRLGTIGFEKRVPREGETREERREIVTILTDKIVTYIEAWL